MWERSGGLIALKLDLKQHFLTLIYLSAPCYKEACVTMALVELNSGIGSIGKWKKDE